MKRKFAAVLAAAALAAALAVPAAASYAAENVASTSAASGLYLAPDGTLLVTDTKQNLVLSVSGGAAVTLAGTAGVIGPNGIPVGGYYDGDAGSALFSTPWAVTPFLRGYAVSDSDNNVVRYIVNGKVKTLCGGKTAGLANGIGEDARFRYPTGLTADSNGYLYIADTGNNVIRRISPDGYVATWAGTDAGLSGPTGICWYDGALYAADTGNNRIVSIKNGVTTVLAGASGDGDYVEGAAADARFASPQGVAVGSGGEVYIADTGNSAVRLLKDGRVSTVYSGGSVVSPTGLAVSGGKLYVSDAFTGAVVSLTQSDTKTAFTDVADGDWFKSAVDYAYDSGLLKGVTDAAFVPQGGMTRAMFAAVLGRLETRTHPNAIIGGDSRFSDVDSAAWYAGAVSWAADNNLANGSGGLFAPEREISRQELAVLLYRYAAFDGQTVSSSSSVLDKYSDSADIAGWAKDAVAWAVENGVLTGDNRGRLLPAAAATRAEAAAILSRFISG